MKFYNSNTAINITMYFLFILLWINLFTNASKDENIAITEDLENDITYNLQHNDLKRVNFEKFRNKEIQILANMEKDELYDFIQTLYQERIKPALIQKPNTNSDKTYDTIDEEIVSTTYNCIENNYNFMNKMDTNSRKYTIMKYLTLRDIIPFGFTCKTLFAEVFEFKEDDGKRTLKKFCSMDIPAHIVPHLKYLLEEAPENLPTIKVIHQIKKDNVFGYSLNCLGKMLTWKNHDAIEARIVSPSYEEGNVVTWGNQNRGGDSSVVQDQLQNIQMIFSTRYAFAALKTNGNVVTWGDQSGGGNSTAVQNLLKNVKMIFSTLDAFAALTTDANVVSWGRQDRGGDSSIVQDQLQNIKTIFSTNEAFSALKYDGNVVTWGYHSRGGNSFAVQHRLKNIKIIFSSLDAFAALTVGGNVVTWGSQINGVIPILYKVNYKA